MLDGEIHVAMVEGCPRVPVQRRDDSPSGRPMPEAFVTRPWDPSCILDLTRAIARSDHAAFDRFYSVYFPRLYRYLLVCSGGWEEGVQEALQESMIRVVRHMKPFADEADLWNWLRRIARSSLIDQVRRARRRPASVTLTAIAEPIDGGADEDGSAELADHLRLCLEALEQGERHLVEGKYFVGKSHRVLAGEQGLTPKAVESRLARIRKKLKTLMLERLSR